jgi:hypothetical protein
VGKTAVFVLLLVAVALPSWLFAAPGNSAGELAREEVMFQGMIDQLCSMQQNGANIEAALQSLNNRRNAAYRKRGRPVPESLDCESDDDDDDNDEAS